MPRFPLERIAPAVLAIAGAAFLALALVAGPGKALQAREPGSDRAGVAPSEARIEIRALGRTEFVPRPEPPPDIPGVWPRFRGPHFDNINREDVPLAGAWSPGGPPVLWSVELGEGYAAAAVLKGRVYVMDYDRVRQADVLRCLALADGTDVWRFSYPVKVMRYHGMSRTIPAVDEKHVVALGPKAYVVCCDAATGELRWAIDLVADWGARVPRWYAGQCPLIDGDVAILAPAGTALMIAVDLSTGAVQWTAPNPANWTMTHSSIIPMDYRGKRTYVYCGSGGVAGVSAADGSILWTTTEWRIGMATVPSPVIAGEDRIFLTGGYNAGSAMLALEEKDGAIASRVLYRIDAKGFASIQQTPICYEGHLYGVKYDGRLACADLDGKIRWTSGGRKFALGPIAIAGGRLYALGDQGLLVLAEATPDGYRELASAQVLAGHEAWGPLAIAGGRLLARDSTRMVCLDIRAR